MGWLYAGVSQLARESGSYPECHWFESDRRYHKIVQFKDCTISFFLQWFPAFYRSWMIVGCADTGLVPPDLWGLPVLGSRKTRAAPEAPFD